LFDVGAAGVGTQGAVCQLHEVAAQRGNAIRIVRLAQAERVAGIGDVWLVLVRERQQAERSAQTTARDLGLGNDLDGDVGLLYLVICRLPEDLSVSSVQHNLANLQEFREIFG
jgi:hypothetical protein